MLARNETIFKWVLYAAAALLCFFIQGAVLQRITVWGVIPFLYPALAAIPATYEGPVSGTVFALCVGVVCDLLLPASSPCLYTLAFPLAGLCAGIAAATSGCAVVERVVFSPNLPVNTEEPFELAGDVVVTQEPVQLEGEISADGDILQNGG